MFKHSWGAVVIRCAAIFAFAWAAVSEAAPHLSLGMYGSASSQRQRIYKNVQDTAGKSRWVLDLERFSFEPEVEFTNRLELEGEIEVEHAGTGASMEFDGFEEFGEFETEIEQGGEVKLEKLDLTYKAKSWFMPHGGLIAVPVGWTSLRELPTDHFSVERNRAEARIIPATWREVGVGFFGQYDSFVYRYAFVSALNSEFFRKYNWVAGGAQRRFETNFGDSFAHVVRLDYGFARDHQAIGFSFYRGDGTGNRQKTDKLTQPSHVIVADLHAIYQWEGFKTRALYMRGYLQNANLVSQANSSLAGLANPGVYSTVGKEAEAAFIEAGYDLAQVWPGTFGDQFDVFARWDRWDTNKVPATGGVRDPRFAETVYTLGVNAYLAKQVVLKAQYARVRSDLTTLPTDHQVAIGLGFTYFPKMGDDAYEE